MIYTLIAATAPPRRSRSRHVYCCTVRYRHLYCLLYCPLYRHLSCPRYCLLQVAKLRPGDGEVPKMAARLHHRLGAPQKAMSVLEAHMEAHPGW